METSVDAQCLQTSKFMVLLVECKPLKEVTYVFPSRKVSTNMPRPYTYTVHHQHVPCGREVPHQLRYHINK